MKHITDFDKWESNEQVGRIIKGGLKNLKGIIKRETHPISQRVQYLFKDSIPKNIISRGLKLIQGENYNLQPAVLFDRKFGTTCSKIWKFPNDLKANQIWKLIKPVLESPKFDKKSPPKAFKQLLDRLEFPHPDYDNLPYEKKTTILVGMISGFNYDDIVSFTIKDIKGFNSALNKEVKEIEKSIGYKFGWVLSEPTLTRVKKELL